MNERPFGASGERVPEIGLGTWQLGGDWGSMRESMALATLSAAVDSGVRFLDTADVYGAGRSERLIGQFLPTRRERLFVATKLGRFPEPGGAANFTADTFRAHTEASLERLGVETLDLTQLHCLPRQLLEEGAVFDWLRDLREKGLIRRFGASVESMREAHTCLEQEGLESLQIIFNLFRQNAVEDLFERAQDRGVSLIVRLPLASGLLAGKITADTHFAKSDHRNYNRDGDAFNVGETFAGIPQAAGAALVDELRPLIPAGEKMALFALRWILDHDAVSVVIPGASNPDQARKNCRASGVPPLSRDLHDRLRNLYTTRVRAHIRGPQ